MEGAGNGGSGASHHHLEESGSQARDFLQSPGGDSLQAGHGGSGASHHLEECGSQARDFLQSPDGDSLQAEIISFVYKLY